MAFMAKRLNFQKYLFLILLLAFSLGEVARIQFSNGVAIKALDAAVFIFVISSIVFLRKGFKSPNLTKPIVIFSFVAGVSLLVNFINLEASERFVSFLYLLRWIMYAGVYLVVANFDSKLKRDVYNFLIALGGIVLSLGFIQYFFYTDLRNLYYLGWDEHLYRLFSIFLDPNFAGAFFVLYFLFVLGLFLKNKKLTYGVILALTFTAIILTFSRSAYLMFFAGLLTFSCAVGKKKIIVGFTLFFAGAIVVASLVGFRSEGTNLLRTASSLARLDTAQNALIIFEKNPVVGVGFNAYKYASKRYGLVEESRYDNHSAAGTDNSFLFVLATTGILGFAAYLYLWFKILSLAKSGKSVYSAILLSSSVALFVGSLFINSLFYTFIMLWMWIILGLSED